MSDKIYYFGTQKDPVLLVHYFGAERCSTIEPQDGDVEVIHRRRVVYNLVLEEPGVSYIRQRVVSTGSEGAVVTNLEQHQMLPFVGVVPCTLRELRNPAGAGQIARTQRHFVFHRPTGDLCAITFAEWYSARHYWQRHVENEIKSNAFPVEQFVRIKCLSTPGGYWKDPSMRQVAELLSVVKIKYIPDLVAKGSYIDSMIEDGDLLDDITAADLLSFTPTDAAEYLRSRQQD